MLTAAEAITAVRIAVADRPGTTWIGVDGRGASGKTTLALAIAAELPGAEIIQVDDFARPDVRGWDRDRFVQQVLEPLLAGRPAYHQRWDFDRNLGADWVTVPIGVPIIVEGVSATDVRLAVPWDVTLWLEAPAELRWSRILERDAPDRLERWRTDWLPSEDAYVAEQQPQQRADLIVSASG